MKDFLSMLKAAMLNLELRNIVNIISVAINPFSERRKRPMISRYIRYTKDILKKNNFAIGEFTYGVPTIYEHPGIKLKIGKFCSIAGGVGIRLGGNHRTDLVTTYPFGAFPDEWPKAKYLRPEDVDAVSKGDVTIGNDVWIGHGAIILSGVKMGDGAVIGVKSAVTKDVEPYAIVAGNPARVIEKRFDDETIRKLLEIKWWDWPIGKVKSNLHIICSDNLEELIAVSGI